MESALQAFHIPYTLLDVTQHPQERDRIKTLGVTTPCLFRNDNFIMVVACQIYSSCSTL